MSSLYLDMYLGNDKEDRWRMKIWDKRDDFNMKQKTSSYKVHVLSDIPELAFHIKIPMIEDWC